MKKLVLLAMVFLTPTAWAGVDLDSYVGEYLFSGSGSNRQVVKKRAGARIAKDQVLVRHLGKTLTRYAFIPLVQNLTKERADFTLYVSAEGRIYSSNRDDAGLWSAQDFENNAIYPHEDWVDARWTVEDTLEAVFFPDGKRYVSTVVFGDGRVEITHQVGNLWRSKETLVFERGTRAVGE